MKSRPGSFLTVLANVALAFSLALAAACSSVERVEGGAEACAANLEAIGKALDRYAMAHAGAYPQLPGDDGVAELQVVADLGFLESPRVLVCPASKEQPARGGGRGGWTIQKANLSYRGLDRQYSMDDPALTPILWDSTPSHGGRRCVLFADGHAETVDEDWFRQARVARSGPDDGGRGEAGEEAGGGNGSRTKEGPAAPSGGATPQEAVSLFFEVMGHGTEDEVMAAIAPDLRQAWLESRGSAAAIRRWFETTCDPDAMTVDERVEYEDKQKTRALVLVQLAGKPTWCAVSKGADGRWFWDDPWEN